MKTNTEDLLITHLFDAPRELVFDAWTDPAHLQHWYAPDGCDIVFKSIDVRVGGRFHSVVQDPVHGECWITGEYLEVNAPERLVFTMELCNEEGIPVSATEAGKSKDWPPAIMTTITFESLGEQTKLTLHQTVPVAEAKKTGAYQSWFSMFDRLSALLVTSK